MSHTPHQLAEEFPEHAEKIHNLKGSDTHFARLFDEYHIVNRAIHRAETLVEPVEDLVEQDMRKTRLRLKDEIYSMLSGAET